MDTNKVLHVGVTTVACALSFFILQNKSDVFKMKTTVNVFKHKF